MLIDAITLHHQLDDTDWLVCDCRHDLLDAGRGAAAYAAGHIPGAVFVPVETALSGIKTGRNGRHPLPRAEDFAEFLNRLGVTPDTRLVAYDDVGGQYAARLWWLARWIGLSQAAVLDGGLAAWKAAGLPLTTAVPLSRGQGSIAARPDDAQWVGVATVAAAGGGAGDLVIDARAPERFRGESEPIDRIAGRIPGARNRFFKDNLRSDLTMRPAAELKEEFTTLLAGRSPERVIHQCGSGVTACVNLLAMEYAGLRGSKLYPGSWSEWIADSARPVARGAVT